MNDTIGDSLAKIRNTRKRNLTLGEDLEYAMRTLSFPFSFLLF